MNKQHMKHIAYYTGKVAQEGERHARESRNSYRNNRLLLYKRMLNKMIKDSLAN